MRERPILFGGDMIRAILEGQKSVTRRAMKPQPTRCDADDPRGGHWWPSKTHRTMLHVENELQNREVGWEGLAADACPYGRPGDRLWVRENWVADAQVNAISPRDLSPGEPILYPADGSLRQKGCSMISPGRTRSSIHMPAWASRILLEITAVRIERLQGISEDQALAEGARAEPRDHARQACIDIGCWGDTAKGAFAFLWEQLNGQGSWHANPWVWVVEFKVVTDE